MKENTSVFEAQRRQLVEYISGIALQSPRIKKAFLEVRRENFLPEKFRQFSYSDEAVRIGEGQTISQPSTIAHMLELLDVREDTKVLEIGAGSGYVMALLSKITGEKGRVFGVEFLPELAKKAKENIESEKITNYELLQGDGSKGWAEHAPFDRILVSCACPFIPKPLFEQLADGGRIVAPVGDLYSQQLEIMEKVKGKLMKKTAELGMFVFVPLRGEHGFR